MIAIIDYDAGNIRSVEKALQMLGEQVVVSREREILLQAEKVILPGVGAFGDAMNKIRSYELEELIHKIVNSGTPFLGICLGLQLLFDGSEEAEGVRGLGLLEGDILKIPEVKGLKIPHMGWNSLKLPRKSILFSGISEESYVYFVHSFYLKAKDSSIVTATTDYATNIHAAVEKGNIYGCQFHPEKSSGIGLSILKNFTQIGKEDGSICTQKESFLA